MLLVTRGIQLTQPCLHEVGTAGAREGGQRLPCQGSQAGARHIPHQRKSGCTVCALTVAKQLTILWPSSSGLYAVQQACKQGRTGQA